MFFIPGPVIAALTFPGVIIHEAGHLFFCRLFKLQVFDVCFFRFGNPAGYVVHQEIHDFRAQFFVSMWPFFANTLLCAIFCTTAGGVPCGATTATQERASYPGTVSAMAGRSGIPFGNTLETAPSETLVVWFPEKNAAA